MEDIRKEFDEKLVKFRKDNESRFYEFGKRIADFNPLIADMSVLKKEMVEIRSLIASHTSSVQKDISSVKSSLRDHDEKHAEKSSKIEAISGHIVFLKSSHEVSSGKIQEINDKINYHSDKVDAVSSKVQDLNQVALEFRNHKKIYEDNFREMNLEMIKIKTRMQTLNDSFVGFNVTLNKYQEFTNEYSKEKSDFQSSIARFGLALDQLKTSLANDLYQKFYECMIKCKDMVDGIKIPNISNLAAQDSIDKISSKVDFLSMDCKNALLKTNNLDMQNQIMTKKLDTVMTLLQKYELSSKL